MSLVVDVLVALDQKLAAISWKNVIAIYNV